MDLVNGIFGVAMTLFFFGVFSMLLTSPSWLVGRLSGKDLGDRQPSALLRSKTLRWSLWIAASFAAYIGLFFLVMPQTTNVPLGLGLLIPGAICAQWGAFAIGRARRLARIRFVTEHPPYVPPVYGGDGSAHAQSTLPYYPAQALPVPVWTGPGDTAGDSDYPLARPVDDEYPPVLPASEYPLARPIDHTEEPHA